MPQPWFCHLPAGGQGSHLTLVNLFLFYKTKIMLYDRSHKLLGTEMSQHFMRLSKNQKTKKAKNKTTLQEETRSDSYIISQLPNSLKRNHIQSSHYCWAMMREGDVP